MSINELHAGRNVHRIVWDDDQAYSVDDDGLLWMQVVEVTGEMANVPWIKVRFEDGSEHLVNPRHLALIEFSG